MNFWDDAVDVQIVLIAVLSGLVAVLAAEVTVLRAGRDEWRKRLEGVGDALLKAENHAQMLKQAAEDQRNAAARALPAPGVTPTPPEVAAPAPPLEPLVLERDSRDLDTDEIRQIFQPPSHAGPGRDLDTDEIPHVSPALSRAGPGRNLEKIAGQLYQEWCANDQRPFSPAGIDISYLRYAGDQRTSELSPSMHVFSDDPQMGEFVRFSLSASETGLAFPNPEAYFNARVHHILFPGLTADSLGNHRQLASTRPVEVQRQGDGLWQKAP